MKLLATAAVATAAFVSLCYAAKPDPVLMTVGGRDVRLSEFEYLYNKNKSQQEKPVTLDEYLGMFADYKMKVLAAEAAGLDTAASFRADIDNFAAELAEPYLTDSTVTDSLARLTYDRMSRDVDVSHILITADRVPGTARRMALLDSLRTLLAAGADFTDLALRFSTDRAVKRNGGRLGYIVPGNYPYEIEDRAYRLKPGEVSEPFTTRFGSHLIRVNGDRPDVGKVKTRHILKFFGNDSAAAKRSIDSIYQALLGGADFATLARQTTDEPAGRATGGDLPLFGSGAMVPEFEAVAFSLKDGEISKPFTTPFGYHVVLRESGRQRGTFEEERPAIDKMMARDYRATMGRERRIEQFAAQIGATVNPEAAARVSAAAKTSDTTPQILESLKADRTVAATVGRDELTVADIAAAIPGFTTPADLPAAFNRILNDRRNTLLAAAAREMLRRENPEYMNLLNEYHDGILLYEISDAEVWGKANNDAEGLKQYFEAHRADYSWDKPRYKGFVLMATTDSLVNAARDLVSANPTAPADTLNKMVRRTFGNTVRLERVLAPQGANPVIDYVAFGGPRPEAMGQWRSFAPVRSRVIAQPEEVADVKGQVSVDYQKQLEKAWLDRLHRTYKVKVNDKVLRQIR